MSGEQRGRAAWPLVDRGPSLDVVTDALDSANVIVVGSAGIGKTGLATLVDRRWRERGSTVLWVHGSHAGRDTPLSAYAAFTDGTGAGTAATIAATVRSELGPLDADPLLVVDDAQWLDPGSLVLTRQLIGAGVRLLATVRTGEPGADEWLALADDGAVTAVTLEAADRSLCASIVGAALGGTPAPALVDRLHERSAGNLLFLRELLLGGLDNGSIVDAGRRWELHGALPDDGDLATVLSRRLRSLDESPLVALVAIALLEPVPDDLFRHLPEADHVPDLERRGLVVVSTSGATGVAHPLIGAAARASIPTSRLRRELDRITEVVLGKLDRHDSDLALRLVTLRVDHELFVPAVWSGAAAARAFALLDHALATRLGLAALAVDPDAVEARLAVGAALSAQMRTEEAEPHLRAALAAAVTDDQRARAAGRLGLHLGIRAARPDDALEVMRSTLAGLVDPDWRSFLAADISKIELMSGRGDGAGAPTPGGDEPVARLNQAIFGALVHATAGDVVEADRQIAIGLELAPDHVGVLPNGGDLLRLAQFVSRLLAGDLDGAEELARSELEACAAGRDEPEGMWLAMLATSAATTGRPTAALELAERAIPLVAARDFVGGLHPSTQALRAVALAQLHRDTDADAQLAEIAPAWHDDPRTKASMLHARAWRDRALAGAGGRFESAATSAVDAGLVASAVPIAYDAVRLGLAEAVADLLGSIAASAPSTVATQFHAHAVAQIAGDAAALVDVSRELERLGLLVFAAEARAAAARCAHDHDVQRGRWLLAEARDLLRRAGEVASAVPELTTDDTVTTLTARQLEVARLAAARWRSREIADHLGLSTRTVDNLLGRTYRALGIASRDELAALIDARE